MTAITVRVLQPHCRNPVLPPAIERFLGEDIKTYINSKKQNIRLYEKKKMPPFAAYH